MSENQWGVDFKRPTTWAIIAFIVLLVVMFARESKAETMFEIAPESTFVAGNPQTGSVLFLTETFADRYTVGIALATALDCRSDPCHRGASPTNQGIYAQRIVKYYDFEMGIGVSYWHNTTAAWSSHTPFNLHLGWNFNDHLSARWRHFSTGGSSDRNGGWDMLTVGWTF